MSVILEKPWAQQPQEASGINATSPQANGLVRWWPLIGDARELVRGDSGTATNGQRQAAQPIGLAADFDGTDDYISTPSSLLAIGNTFTVAFWMRMTANPASTRQFVFGSNDAASALQVEVGIGNGVYGSSVGIQFSGTHVAAAGGVVFQNRWQHWVITRTGTSPGSTSIYRDGVVVSMSVDNGGTFADATTARRIGQRSAGQPLPFQGQLSDLRIYDRALDASLARLIWSDGYDLHEPQRIWVPVSAGMKLRLPKRNI